jgi:hypothetical protein
MRNRQPTASSAVCVARPSHEAAADEQAISSDADAAGGEVVPMAASIRLLTRTLGGASDTGKPVIPWRNHLGRVATDGEEFSWSSAVTGPGS